MQKSVRIAVPLLALAVVAGWFLLPQEKRADVTADVSATMSRVMPAAGDDVIFVPHKALYTFKMVSMGSGSGLTDVRGKMYYEQDDACDAWTTDHRFTTEYHYPERSAVLNTSHYVAWEAKDKSLFHFSSERQENSQQAEQLRGAVALEADGTAKADYSRPEDLSFDLPKGYYLPTGHTEEIIRHAIKGDKFFNAILFDGTDAEGPVEVNAFIGKAATPAEIDAIAARDAKIDKKLLSPRAWHVRMAVFPLADKQSATPSYEMDLLVHDNGVVSDAVVDYKLFKVGQQLAAIEALPAKPCP